MSPKYIGTDLVNSSCCWSVFKVHDPVCMNESSASTVGTLAIADVGKAASHICNRYKMVPTARWQLL